MVHSTAQFDCAGAAKGMLPASPRTASRDLYSCPLFVSYGGGNSSVHQASSTKRRFNAAGRVRRRPLKRPSWFANRPPGQHRGVLSSGAEVGIINGPPNGREPVVEAQPVLVVSCSDGFQHFHGFARKHRRSARDRPVNSQHKGRINPAGRPAYGNCARSA